MWNASSFMILCHVNNQSHFPKEARKSNPLLVKQSLHVLSIKISILNTNAHETVNSMRPKSDCKWCEITPFRPTTASHLSLHSFWATFLQLAFLGPHKSHSIPSLVHQQQSFTDFGFSTLQMIHISYQQNFAQCKIMKQKNML